MPLNKTILYSVLITSLVFISAGVGLYFGLFYEPQEQVRDVVLTLTKDENSVNFTMDELKDLSGSMTGYGGYKKTTATIVGPYQYKGIPVFTLLDETGGITTEDQILVTATDQYRMTYTYNMIDGKVTTYNETGDDQGINDVTMVLLYEEVGAEELAGGPLRIGYLSPEGYLTDGHLWAKYVESIEIQTSGIFWEVNLSGFVNYTVDSSYYEAAMYCPNQDPENPHRISYIADEGGELANYEGMAVWRLIAMVDSYNDWDHDFNDSLIGQGYQVVLKSKIDGVEDVILSFDDIARDNGYILAFKKNSLYLQETIGPLKLVGPEVTVQQVISGINEIWLIKT